MFIFVAYVSLSEFCQLVGLYALRVWHFTAESIFLAEILMLTPSMVLGVQLPRVKHALFTRRRRWRLIFCPPCPIDQESYSRKECVYFLRGETIGKYEDILFFLPILSKRNAFFAFLWSFLCRVEEYDFGSYAKYYFVSYIFYTY